MPSRRIWLCDRWVSSRAPLRSATTLARKRVRLVNTPEQHLKSFYFSDFSFDSITHVEITAAVKEGGVHAVEAHGPTYDGKQFFQSLFSAGQLADDAPPDPNNPFDIDLTAHFGTVVGFYDTSVQDLQMSLKKRDGRLVALDAKGQLNANAPMAVRLETGNGARVIKAAVSRSSHPR